MRSYPWENSQSNTATLSSFELLWGDVPFTNSSLPMHVFSAYSTNQTDLGGGLNTAISTETSTCGHLLSEVYMFSSPQRGLHATISSVISVCGHCLTEVYARPSPQGLPGGEWSSPQQGPHMTIFSTRPEMSLLRLAPCWPQLGTTSKGIACGRAQ